MSALTQCSVDGCDIGGKIRRGLCGMHYNRLRRRGLTPLPTSVEKFTAASILAPNGCLEWTRGTNGTGYGTIHVDGRLALAHRFAWELAHGPIPAGLCVLHRCDNPPCVQTEPTEGYPEGHLFLGTIADNNKDMADKGRRRSGEAQRAITHCPQGHPYDEANTCIRRSGWRSCRACARDRARNQSRIKRAAS